MGALTMLGFTAPLDHDEHQFVASGVLLARDGLLPYRDFPYHHLPYLTFIYALVFAATDHLLLAARLVSVAFGVGSVVLVGHLVHRAFEGLRPWLRLSLALAFAITLAVNPLFMYASGRAWNHNASVFFALVAFICMHRAAHARRYEVWLALSGAAIGVAVGIRSSFALLIPGFLFGAVVLPQATQRDGFARTVAFTLGLTVALAPLIPLFLVAPAGFLHGNLRYNIELTPEYWHLLGNETAMSISGKLEHLLFQVAPMKRNVALCVAWLAVLMAVVARPGRRFGFELHLLGVLLPLLLLAALSATPSWYQYFYQLVPFLLLIVVFGCADHRVMRFRAAALGCTGILLAGSTLALRHYMELFGRASQNWIPICVHELGEKLVSRTGKGRFLTLAPIFPLEGKASIYPELATGPFSWRTAMLIPAAERAKLRVAGPAELEALTTVDMPAGILTGLEPRSRQKLEDPLVAFAQVHGYRPRLVQEMLTLWSKNAQVRADQRFDEGACPFDGH